MTDFPLSGWFDLTKPISMRDRERCEIQMVWNAYENGEGMWKQNVLRACVALRAAIKRHNETFESSRLKKARVDDFSHPDWPQIPPGAHPLTAETVNVDDEEDETFAHSDWAQIPPYMRPLTAETVNVDDKEEDEEEDDDEKA